MILIILSPEILLYDFTLKIQDTIFKKYYKNNNQEIDHSIIVLFSRFFAAMMSGISV